MKYSTSILIGDKVREVEDHSRSGAVTGYQNAPDGVIVVFTNENGQSFGAYDFMLEWVD